jgi:hypothetical protein
MARIVSEEKSVLDSLADVDRTAILKPTIEPVRLTAAAD